MMKNVFISFWKIISFSWYLSFCFDFLVMQEKRLNKKDTVNLEIHGVTAWLTKNYNTHNVQFQYLTK